MSRPWPLLAALAVVVVGPIVLRPGGDEHSLKGQDSVVIITPHNEAIRAEFGRGFREWYERKTGRTVGVDFRTPGGTSENSRYVSGQYQAAFRNYWERTLKKPWSKEVEAGFTDAKIVPDNTPDDDTPAQAARRAFLTSEVGCGMDVFFGGGSFDFIGIAGQGFLVDCGYVAKHPDLFGKGKPIEPTMSGEPYYDEGGRWIGTAIGAFGIAFNRDRIAKIGIESPKRWADIADPRYFQSLALANPTQSSSANKAFEMLIQQQMNETGEDNVAGWQRAIRMLQRIGANARYFSDSSAKISLDVESGEAAAGMTIDFYGRYQSEAVRRADGSSRIGYVDAQGGTSFGVDPIGMLRGAQNKEVATAFIEFVLGDGQKIWGWKAGTEGGPKTHALRRLPVLPSLYGDEFRPFRSDPDVLPYVAGKEFTYDAKRTGGMFGSIAFIVRVMCVDTHPELKEAWSALIAAREKTGAFPPEALAAFEDVSFVDYPSAKGRIKEALGKDSPKIRQVQLAKELSDKFRANYRKATDLARQGR
jgi:iron(III) transport system substrate-binding protein